MLTRLSDAKYLGRFILDRTYSAEWPKWAVLALQHAVTISKVFEQFRIQYIQSIHLYRLYSFERV